MLYEYKALWIIAKDCMEKLQYNGTNFRVNIDWDLM